MSVETNTIPASAGHIKNENALGEKGVENNSEIVSTTSISGSDGATGKSVAFTQYETIDLFIHPECNKCGGVWGQGKLNKIDCLRQGLKKPIVVQCSKCSHLAIAKEAHDDSGSVPKAELDAAYLYPILENYVLNNKSRFIRADDEQIHLLEGSKRIPLNHDPQSAEQAGLMERAFAGQMTHITTVGQLVLMRLKSFANRNAKAMSLRRFAATVGNEIQIPVGDGADILAVGEQSWKIAKNGAEKIWIEGAGKNNVLAFDEEAARNPVAGLKRFETLCVDTQKNRDKSMRWFVAMFAGLFPFVRDPVEARMTVFLTGEAGAGKSAVGKRFCHLHGLGEVKGNVTTAAIYSRGDNGLLILDNKESKNIQRSDWNDFFLFMATGGEHERANSDGKSIRRGMSTRPALLATAIEGMTLNRENMRRVVEVEYLIHSLEEQKAFNLSRNLAEIDGARDLIRSAFVPVLQSYLRISKEEPETYIPNKFAAFPEHYIALANLLRAYGEQIGREKLWAESILEAWAAAIDEDGGENEDMGDFYVKKALRSSSPAEIKSAPFTLDAKP